jgi:hypothetical protein
LKKKAKKGNLKVPVITPMVPYCIFKSKRKIKKINKKIGATEAAAKDRCRRTGMRCAKISRAAEEQQQKRRDARKGPPVYFKSSEIKRGSSRQYQLIGNVARF